MRHSSTYQPFFALSSKSAPLCSNISKPFHNEYSNKKWEMMLCSCVLFIVISVFCFEKAAGEVGMKFKIVCWNTYKDMVNFKGCTGSCRTISTSLINGHYAWLHEHTENCWGYFRLIFLNCLMESTSGRRIIASWSWQRIFSIIVRTCESRKDRNAACIRSKNQLENTWATSSSCPG